MDDAVLDHLDPEIRNRESSIAEDGQHALSFKCFIADIHTAEQYGPAYLLEVRPPPEFNTESARNKLMNLNLATDDGPRVDFVTPGDVFGTNGEDGGGRQEQLLRFAGFIDLDNSITVSSHVHHPLTASGILTDKNSAWMCWCCHIISAAPESNGISARRSRRPCLLPHISTSDVQLGQLDVHKCRHTASAPDH